MVIWFCGRCWCMAGLTPRFSTLRIIVVYPLFIACHDTVQKPFLFYRWSSSSHLTKRRSTPLGFNSNGTQCPCFWIIPITFKRFETVDSSTRNVFPSFASAWDRSSLSISSNSMSLNYFCVRTFFILEFKIIIFEASKSVSACRIRQSIVTISLIKNTMYFSCRFCFE